MVHPFLFGLLVAASPPSPTAILGSGFRMTLPAPVVDRSDKVSLPWGQAVERLQTSGDASTTLLIFGTYDWPGRQGKIGGAELRKMRSAFLRHRGCTAHDLPAIGLRDADDRLWPQTAFEGECEGGDSFRAAFLIANGALYHFQVVQQATIHRQTRPPLGEVLKGLVGAFSAQEERSGALPTCSAWVAQTVRASEGRAPAKARQTVILALATACEAIPQVLREAASHIRSIKDPGEQARIMARAAAGILGEACSIPEPLADSRKLAAACPLPQDLRVRPEQDGLRVMRAVDYAILDVMARSLKEAGQYDASVERLLAVFTLAAQISGEDAMRAETKTRARRK